MSNPFVARVGGILSADIAVPEHEREVRFYSHVLSAGENPPWREDLMNSLGMPIIGLGERSSEYAHLPLQWMPHIQVADVSASLRHALSLGASELMHAEIDQGESQWAVLLDPNGAAFGIIPVVSAEEMSASDDAGSSKAGPSVGCISWADLTVPDAETTRDFYRQVVGWSAQDVEMEDTNGRYVDYTMLGDDGNPAAGVCQARGVNADLPAVWLIYLPVDDLALSLRRVQEGGGRIITEARVNEGRSGYAVVQDPVGAYVGLVPA